MNYDKLYDEVIAGGKYLLENGLVKGSGGNISVRVDEESFVITPSSMEYNLLEKADLLRIKLGGEIIEGFRKPSVEKEMHRLILNNRHDVNAVVHTHSTYATAVAAARKEIKVITDNQRIFFKDKISVAKYGTIGSAELAKNVLAALGNGYGVLLANHGALCVGETLKEALFRSLMLEEFAKIYILSECIGGGAEL